MPPKPKVVLIPSNLKIDVWLFLFVLGTQKQEHISFSKAAFSLLYLWNDCYGYIYIRCTVNPVITACPLLTGSKSCIPERKVVLGEIKGVLPSSMVVYNVRSVMKSLNIWKGLF